MTLDAQLRGAADALDAQDVPVPPLSSLMGARRVRRQRASFATLVVLLLVGAGLAYALRQRPEHVNVGPPRACRSGATQSSPTGTVAEASGAIAGTPFVAWIQADGVYGAVITINGSAVGFGHIATSGQSIDAMDAQFIAVDSTHAVLFGKAPTSVVKVRVLLDTSESSEGAVTPVTDQPFGLFAFGVTTFNQAGFVDNTKATATFLDAQGAEVAHLPLTTSVVHNPCALATPAPEDGFPSSSLTAQNEQWLSEYDPAEVAALLAQAGGADHTNAQELVSVLEYRRACRETRHAADVATPLSGDARRSAVDDIMQPELQRLAERVLGDSAAMFDELRNKLGVGNIDSVMQWLGDCPAALSPTTSS